MDDADRVVLVTCGDTGVVRGAAGLPTVRVAARPGRAEFDAVLVTYDPARLLVAGTDADLAAVVMRLLGAERLDVEVGYLPAERSSAAAAGWGLRAAPVAALDLAAHGAARPVPLVRDDAGGVLVGRGELPGVVGEAYCDDALVLRGRTRRIVVTPGPAGVAVTVAAGALRRPRRADGRAVQVGCEPATVVSDGVPYPRAVRRWTWYRHTADLRLVCRPR